MVGEEGFAEGITHEGCREVWEEGQVDFRFIGPFEVLQRIGEVAYKLALPPNLSSVHPVFHVSMLRKYIGNPFHVLDFSMVHLESDMTYDVEPVAILDRQVQRMRSKDIASVKVQWRGQPVEEDTWATERDIRSKYPRLFETAGMFLDPFKDEWLFKMGGM
ncbi:uncharacterized protein [Nicotiana tomentosiformis]|uniref:uncharacterized protein n=1 Tax=Nicotiana tomentosiformis TaxID=4098 RepID=UPI00388C8C52